MEALVKMLTPEAKTLYTVVEMAQALKLSESRIRAYLGKDGAPRAVKQGEWYGGGRTANLYNFQEFKKFYQESNRTKGKVDKPKVTFDNRLANSFLGGRR
jgi:phage antirepressor YoqD-like protein